LFAHSDRQVRANIGPCGFDIFFGNNICLQFDIVPEKHSATGLPALVRVLFSDADFHGLSPAIVGALVVRINYRRF
jgi:hypothetical protein